MTSQQTEVRIAAHARLHLGFLDLEGGLGRRFGGLGLGLEGPATRLRLARAQSLSVAGEEAKRAKAYLMTLCETQPCRRPFQAEPQPAISAAKPTFEIEEAEMQSGVSGNADFRLL